MGRRAPLGQKTFGKGLVQSVRGLADGSGITVTIAKYLTPKGTDIHKNGIIPDIQAKLTEQQLKDFELKDFGTKEDTQYRIAESILVRQIRSSSLGTTYQAGTPNLTMALSAADQ